MITAVYVAVYTFIIVWLSMRVIGQRLKYRVSVGDGDAEELKIAMGAQSNAVEYLPLSLLLLLCLELNGAGAWLIHVFGITLIAGRAYHINGMFTRRLKYRVLGMRLTISSLLLLSVANLVYLPYARRW